MDGEVNRWEYEWREVTLTAGGGFEVTPDGRGNTTDGLAYNLCEMLNDGADVEGPGWDLANAPGDFNIQPIRNCIVNVRKAKTSTGTDLWVFFAANVLDGQCPEPEEGD
jgi:hypothetical protein